ncbi:carboxymuconolactone decarboxylase family protein [Aestuariivirga litoralis]|nr:carboxymuconolactone decarboxylase family protein [Aestuariivirga litoralis]
MAETADKTSTARPLSGEALSQLQEWDAAWAASAAAMTANPWQNPVLPPRLLALAALAVSCACTSLDGPATSRWIRASLAAGASRAEVLTIIKMATVMSIHSCSLGAPILLDEAKAAGVAAAGHPPVATPACDRMRSMGQWNTAWDPFFELDPLWTEQVMAAGAAIYASGVFSAKEMELLSIAFDASYTHMYAPGTRRHIRSALAAGATVEEVFAILKICVAMGAETLNLAIPLLAEAGSDAAG